MKLEYIKVYKNIERWRRGATIVTCREREEFFVT
jgi:hypothetical protein